MIVDAESFGFGFDIIDSVLKEMNNISLTYQRWHQICWDVINNF